MKKKYKIIKYVTFLLSISTLLFSCKEDNRNKKGIYKTDFPEDKQVMFSEYIIKNGDSILDGNYTVYNYERKKIRSGRYKNGKAIGAVIYYYDNGNIESIDHRNNDKFIDATFNYKNGKIERYIFYDDFGNTSFIIRFDEQSNITSYDGYPIFEIYQYKIANKEKFKTKINQHLKVGDTLKQEYLIANIPNTNRSFQVRNLDVDNAKVKRIFKKTSHLGYEVKEVLTQKGINKMQAIVRYEFRDKQKTIITDTLSFKVTVN